MNRKRALQGSFHSQTELTPPEDLVFIGSGDFKKIGEDFLHYFIELCDLQPHEWVLDVGCGVGRMAIPLTTYLDRSGRYEGFDIVADGIAWCQENITPRYLNFHFYLADVFNQNYHPKGKYQAAEYRFPYDDHTFDFVFLTSVFTHMLPQDLEHYTAEIVRVLKPKGRCLITYFLLNGKSLSLLAAKKGSLDFAYQGEGYRMIDQQTPEAAVAYEEAGIRRLYHRNGLHIHEPIRYGAWCERENPFHYQDIVIASKKG